MSCKDFGYLYYRRLINESLTTVQIQAHIETIRQIYLSRSVEEEWHLAENEIEIRVCDRWLRRWVK